MLIIAKFLAKIISVLNSEISPKQIAAGFAFGAIVGLIPVKGLLFLVLTLVSLILNINLVSMAFAAVLFKIISFALDPLANALGFKVLTGFPGLKSFWTELYNMPVIPYTRFNNTIVMGSLLIGILLFIPLYGLAKVGVVRYRTSVRDKFMKLKIVQILKTSALWRYYESFQNARD